MSQSTSQSTDRSAILGRGAAEGRRLFREWFDRLGRAAEADEKAGYVFVMGSLVELLRAFDMHVVFPEITSLQTAVRQVSGDYLSMAEDDGFSPDVCGYVKADYALQKRGGEHPMGRIPPPSVAVYTNACNTYIKWAEIWERLYGIPIATVDVPGSRHRNGTRALTASARGGGGSAAGGGIGDRGVERGSGGNGGGDASFDVDRRYVEAQIRELIPLLEEVTGRSFDIDRLRASMDAANRMGRAWRRLLELNRARPAPYDAMLEGTIYLGMANAFRGTEEGADYFEDLVEEIELKVERGTSPLDRVDGASATDEHRLIFVGVPCYPIFRRFYELFSDWNGVFVGSTYMWFAAGGFHHDFEYDLSRPLESLAEGTALGVRHATDSMLFHESALLETIDRVDADGVVYHPVKSCRTVSTGLADSRRMVLEERDVLCLYIESDMMDARVVSEAQLKNRIDAFFEGLEARRVRLATPA